MFALVLPLRDRMRSIIGLVGVVSRLWMLSWGFGGEAPIKPPTLNCSGVHAQPCPLYNLHEGLYKTDIPARSYLFCLSEFETAYISNRKGSSDGHTLVDKNHSSGTS
jgi:hypothetical protein